MSLIFSKNYKISGILFLSLFGIILLSFTNNNESLAAEETDIYPSKLNLDFTIDQISKPIEITEFLTTDEKLNSDFIIYGVDLYETKNRQLPIAASKLTITPSTFNSNEPNPKTILLSFNLTDVRPGEYEGKIIIYNIDLPQIEIPVSLTVSENSHWAFIPVILGVAASFILKLSKQTTILRNSVEIAFDETWKIFDKVKYAKKQNAAVVDGVAYWREAKSLKDNGKYDDAKRYLERAKEAFQNSLSMENDPSKIPAQMVDSGKVGIDSLLKNQSRTRSVWTFIGLSVVLGVSVMMVWQDFFPKLSAFGASGIDYGVAFLFGFAGQALLGEATELLNR